MFSIRIFAVMLLISLSVFGKESRPDNEELRWILPADAWRESEAYLAKGHYFRISSDVGGKRYLGGIDGIKMFENPELKGDPYFITYGWVMDKDKKLLCENKSTYKQNYKFDQVLECDNFCHEISKSSKDNLLNNSKEGVLPDIPSYRSALTRTNFGECKIKIDGFSKRYSTDQGPEKDDISYSLTNFFSDIDWGTNFYFKTDDTDFKKGYITLKDGDKKYYLDVRFCIKSPQFCKFVSLDKSEYERDVDRLEKIK
ncbi:MAG: hypothetical protein WDA09_07045, partial [Bacteriovoracaceae bacterium]